MKSNLQLYDTSTELLVQRYRHGIHLVKPSATSQSSSESSISSFYNLPLTVYFTDREDRLLKVNSASVEILGAQSEQEVYRKTAAHFTSKKLGLQVLKNNNAVMNSGKMKTIEERGVRADNFLVEAFTFKFPWYFEDQIIGLFGCSIRMDPLSRGGFSDALFQLIQTGLLIPGNVLPSPLKISKFKDAPLSEREKEVLSLLVRGKTAREIADWICLSKRTIEHCIERIKLKTHCASKSELIEKFIEKLIR